MTRFRAIVLGVVAAFASAGVFLLVTPGSTVTAGRACYAAIGELPDLQPRQSARWFVVVADAFNPGAPAGPSVDCAVESCDGIAPERCFDWKISNAVGGWRLAVFDGHPALGRLWRMYAEANPAGVRFARGYKELATDLRAVLTAAQVRDIIQDVEPCWRKPDGSLCRNGLLYGPGAGGSSACAPAVGDVPYPCSDGGRGPMWADAAVASDWVEP